ncbi:hypothetical protein niasHT_012957 [Heterodera trifolii]|uniref:UBX domain-containing protein n=1 Tax=Heterodera trifolii TaxID=157864 RepID=A0ABD2L9A3_9BILA
MDNNSPGPSNNVNPENKIGKNNAGGPLSDIDLFKEICGIDEPTASALLRESGGDLEAAIHQFFFTRENPEVLQNQDNEVQELRRRAIGDRAQNNQQNQSLPVVSAPPNVPVISWSQWIRGIFLIPFRYIYTTTMDVFFFVFDFFFGGPPRRPPITGNNRQNNVNPAARGQQAVLADRIIMREQQQAYEQALAIDKQKTEQLKIEKQRAQAEADKVNNRKALLARKRGEVAAQIGKTATETTNGTGGGDTVAEEEKREDLVRIRLVFPSSARMEQNFRHSDSLERLFDVAFIHPDCPDNFSLFTNFPVKQLNCAPDWYRSEFRPATTAASVAAADSVVEKNADDADSVVGTFADVGLVKSANVVVRDNDA